MANGFPYGEFRIINQTEGPFHGQCLVSMAAVTSTSAGRVVLHKVERTPGELWYFRDPADQWGHRPNQLANAQPVGDKGQFGVALESTQAFGAYGSHDIVLRGVGSNYPIKVQTEDGFIFQEGRPDLVLTPAPADLTWLVLGPRGKNPGQQWRFESA